jgi:lysophospholipase L1-like esterase
MGYEMTRFPLGPVFALQGRYVRRVMPRLPEAPGPRAGTLGAGSELRLLVLGDSAAAGVGAPSQEEALCGCLTRELAQSFRVSWALVARTGATTAGTTRHLMRSVAARFDVSVVSLGGNDVMGQRPLARWLEDLDELATLLRTRFEVRHLLFSGMPPMHAFPALPQPVRWYLGTRARRFDQALARWASVQPDCEHVPLTLDDLQQLAADGMHPGPLAYRDWSILLARRIRARWTSQAADRRGWGHRHQPDKAPA